MELIKSKAAATDVVAHDVTPLTVNTDAGAYARVGWFIVLAGVLGFVLWAVLAPLDKGVPMSGFVTNEGNRKSIQYQPGGTVDEVLVKEGQYVKKGQVLVRMNPVQATAQAGISKAQLIVLRTTEARLLAERDGKSAPAFPAELEAFKNDPSVIENIALQRQLFTARTMGLQNELAAFDENIAGLKVQLSGLETTRVSRKEQLDILKEQVLNLRDLAKDGYVARSKLLDVERAYSGTAADLAENVANIGRAQRQVAEVTHRRAARLDDYQKEVSTQLADVQKEAGALSARFQAEQYALAHVDVTSPVDGYVIGLAVFTRGGVVQPGFRMMDVVPVDDDLIVEGRLAVNLVDKVHEGLPVELIFAAFNTNTSPHIPGTVTKVSADKLTDEHSGQPYYNVIAHVSPEGLKMMRHKKMDVRPGMPVELFVKTGERTMMSYLLKPVFDRAKTSMSED